MTQKARTDIATHRPGVNDRPDDDVRGAGATNLFGPLKLRQVRELVDRTRDWPEESMVDLNNTDGGSTLLVCRPESGSPQQGLETAPESPSAASVDGQAGRQDLALELAKALKREGDRKSMFQFYERTYWLPIAEQLIAQGWRITEEPSSRTMQDKATDLIALDPEYFRAERDSERNVRLNGGHGALVADRHHTRGDGVRWLVEAEHPHTAARYLAFLNLLDREAGDVAEEPTE